MCHHRRVRVYVLLLAIAAGLGVTVWAVAGPVLVQPRRPELSPTLLSIDQIQKLQLDVVRLPRELVDAGVTRDAILTMWRQRLTNDGYEVVETDGPRIIIHCTIYRDNAYPDLLICVFLASVQQEVTVKRLDKDFFLATCTFSHAGLARPDDLKRTAERLSKELSREFLFWARAVRNAPAQ